MKAFDNERYLPPDCALPSQRPVSLFRQFRKPYAERVLVREQSQLIADANDCRSSLRQVEIQTLLHLPSPEVRDWRDTRRSYLEVRDAVRHRALLISEFKASTLTRADLLRVTAEMRVTRSGIETADGRCKPVDVRPVAPSTGHLYQKRLHYLLSPRADLVHEWGLFEEDCDYPLLYFGFALTDPRILTGLPNLRVPPLTLARAVSIVNLPKNAFSYTIAQVANHLRSGEGAFSGFVTAVNPYLGFTAASVLAGGFRPIATRPVAYWYNERGSFTTRRFRTEKSKRSRRRMPPNIQFFRGVERVKSQPSTGNQLWELPLVPPSVEVGKLSPREFRIIVEEVASAERKRAARHWSDRTKHPDFIGRSPRRGSAGQCGVTSVHVARALIHRIPGVEISYCYGDLVSSTDSVKGIYRHCWLRASMSGVEFVVDCTPDQEGGVPDRDMLVLTDDELRRLGLRYVARTVRTVDALVSDRVWPRYLTLADSLMKEV